MLSADFSMVSGATAATALNSIRTGTNNAQLPASALVEWVASSSSSSVFVYDLAEHIGFGLLTKEWADNQESMTAVIRLQTRSGAGLSLVGRLSKEGMSKDTGKDSVITAYNTPTGLVAMAHSLAYLPPPNTNRRLVIQVPTMTAVGHSLALSPSLAPLAPVLDTLSDTFTVILSSTPKESLELATIAYQLVNSHVIHLFDHYSSAREVSRIVSQPTQKINDASGVTIHDALKSAGYDLFDYAGDNEAKVVVVLLNGPFASAAKALAARITGLGVVVVRLLRPWDERAFRASFPSTVKTMHVLDDVPTEAARGNLYVDVFSTLLESDATKPFVRGHGIVPTLTLEYIEKPALFIAFLIGLIPDAPTAAPALVHDTLNLKKLLFFSTPSSSLSSLPQYILKSFISNRAIRTRTLTDHDGFSKPGGITATRIFLSAKGDVDEYIPIPVLLPLGQPCGDVDGESTADFLAIIDHNLLKTHSLLTYLKHDAPLLVFTSWSAEELVSNISVNNLSVIYKGNIRLYRMDPKALDTEAPILTSEKIQNVLAHLAFLRIYLGHTANEALIGKLAHAAYGARIEDFNVDNLNATAWAALEEIEIPVEGLAQEAVAEEHVACEPKNFEFNTVNLHTNEGQLVAPIARTGSWHDAAKHILFQEAYSPPNGLAYEQGEYPRNPALRPEVPEHTFLVTCTVNRRLTPLEYDRNVFHLEFNTAGTGLKYALGEALGIHGWNDAQEVIDFCQWYGVNPERLITIPVPSGEGKMHTRTVFQALQQQIDIFGRPPKAFYADLSEHSTKKEDRLSLQFIGSPEGSSMFKKLSEKDTITFADVLYRYQSARPGIEVLCEMIGDIKPRHYSIASAQSAVGDRVDLLVVTVDWVTPSGSPRYGQCTRYLAGLKIGQKVTVSIKPSVMKLPPDNIQPIILAGLGTGAAPFRAFWQHRAWLASQNIPVGPLYYYFGSRHRSQEFLYGEEIEAYVLDKIITHVGLAFSRDQKKKVYIQNKMLEDAETLARMLHDNNGVFYLCGPTWPVPDVYEALVGALIKYVGMEPTAAANYLEGLKEEERYVLEVY